MNKQFILLVDVDFVVNMRLAHLCLKVTCIYWKGMSLNQSKLSCSILPIKK